jgi:hypothetical protein
MYEQAGRKREGIAGSETTSSEKNAFFCNASVFSSCAGVIPSLCGQRAVSTTPSGTHCSLGGFLSFFEGTYGKNLSHISIRKTMAEERTNAVTFP